MGLSTIHEIVKETTQALWNALQPRYMAVPSTDEWTKIAHDYNDKWNMSNCIGSIDGKHCRIQRPPNAGSLFYNYKDFHSIVLLAVAEANACFTMIEVGAYEKENDNSIFTQSEMGKAYNARQLNVPRGESSLPGSAHRTEMYVVGDGAFPLQKNLMRPFPRRNLDFGKRNFNFRLSRARKSVECAFGVLAKKFEVLQSCIKTDISQTDTT
ncbi:DDE Tnp4 domain-containing protein [Trichonephila clavata]|uniref:DDE Tnp4 domain-containing protein n=1 Tax=Trichonephila clavata TaxID=2740835 RepID=A0A8X6HS92_TRICU|nr:DDE Tnp4 domain-containing protein [Trichonephila clavata]